MPIRENWNSKATNQQALILEWRQDPCLAAEEILGVDLDNHQRIVLEARWSHDTEIDILSRGCGKTFLNAVQASLEAILWPGHRIGLIGPSFRQSKLIFEEIRRLYEKSEIFQQCCTREPAKTPESCYVNFKAAPGRSGSFIEALPLGSDGAKIRGARYYTVLADEAAQIDPTILNTVVRGFLATNPDPMIQVRLLEEQAKRITSGEAVPGDFSSPRGNKLILSSTAYFQWSHLWDRVAKLMDEILTEKRRLEKLNLPHDHIKTLGGSPNGGQIPHRVISDGTRCITAFNYQDPSRGFVNLRSVQDAQLEMPDHEFRMEYMAYFPPDSDGFFKRSALDATRRHNKFSAVLEPRKGMIYTMGVDPARDGDNFSIAIFEVDLSSQTVNLVRVMTWNKKNFPEMHQNIRKIIKHYGITYFKMDAGGGGTTIRDLLADRLSCPAGEPLILEQEFDEHRVLIGKHWLAPLVQFSKYEWVHDANHNLLSGIQHGRLQIASVPPVPGEIWTQEKEDADEEINHTLTEIASITISQLGTRMHWDTPTKSQRKDRYSAVLLGYDAALFVLNTNNSPKTLASGFWT